MTSKKGKKPVVPRTASAPRPVTQQRQNPPGGGRRTPEEAAGNVAEQMNQLAPVVIQATNDAREAVEKLRGRPCLAYFLAEGAAIADDQMMHLYEHLRRMGHQKELDLFISSRGGATEVPLKVVTLMREFSDRWSVLIPYRAHSSATLIALGADEIVMTDMAELGPIDPTRHHPLLPRPKNAAGEEEAIGVSVQDLRHVLQFLRRELAEAEIDDEDEDAGEGEKKDPHVPADVAVPLYEALFENVHPLAIGALEQSWELARQICRGVLSTHMDPEKEKDDIERIVERLSDSYKSHVYPIGRKEAKTLGLKITEATTDESIALWTLNEAFRGLVIQGEGVGPGGVKTTVQGIGYFASPVAVTIGLAMLDPKGKAIGANWMSMWTVGPGGAPLQGAPATPPPAAPATPPAPAT